jgi:hypothetical protein
MKKPIIITLLLVLLVTLYWNYQQRKEITRLFASNLQQKTNYQQIIKQLETQIYQTNQDAVKARKDFWKLRLLVNEWNILKGTKEIKELIEQMRNNPLLEEIIK